MERHRIKTQGFLYQMKYIPGKDKPTDYGSRHPLPLSQFTSKEIDNMIVEQGDDICISRIITDDLPDSVTLETMQKATQLDPILQKLIKCIKKGYIINDEDLKPYKKVFHELTHASGVVLKGEKLVIPDVELNPLGGSIQQHCIELAHEGHQGNTKTKRLARAKFWFPGIDAKIEDRIQKCLGCQATTLVPHRDPLTPTPPPERLWALIDMDIW